MESDRDPPPPAAGRILRKASQYVSAGGSELPSPHQSPYALELPPKAPDHCGSHCRHTVADGACGLGFRPDHEARLVDEVNDWQMEGVAHFHKTAVFLRRFGSHRSGVVQATLASTPTG